MQIFTLITVLLTSLLLCGTCTSLDVEKTHPYVNTSYGPIKGKKFTSSWTNEIVYAFRGIPYATPPIGDLRFKEPLAPEPWTEVLDCTSDKASCYQPSDIFSSSLRARSSKLTSSDGMSEDCLFLNVYTPELQLTSLMPVIVWIHGGAYVTGCANYSNYGPDLLVAQGVVVVSMNYRLGSFGLLTLGTVEAPGNLMFKDQRLALLWVQQEIQLFGGDPGQVTIFGQSSGSASVHLHYLSPLSKDLFHRAIADSGTAVVSWAARDDAVWYGLQLAEYANCSTTDMTETLACLQDLSADDILLAQIEVPPSPADDNKGWTLRWTAAVDSWSYNPFLPELPIDLMKKKSGSHVPILMGTVRDEGSLDIFAMNETQIEDTPNNIDKFIPFVTSDVEDARLETQTKRLDQFYFNGTTPSYNNMEGFIKLNTDAWFMYLTVVSARYYREMADVYLYYFTYDGSFKDPSTVLADEYLGLSLVAHAEELNYLYIVEDVNQTAAEDSTEWTTSRRMVRMWTNFAKYGVPTNGTDPLLQNVTWLPVDFACTRHLLINTELTMVAADYLAERVALWDSVLTALLTSSGRALHSATLPLLLATWALAA